MSKNWNNFFLGLAIAVLPWLGLPASWKSVILTVAGLLVALFSLAHYGSQSQPRLPFSGGQLLNKGDDETVRL